MKFLVLFVFCVGVSRADSQAEATEVTSNTKLSSSKSSLNSIQSAPQKPTIIQQQQQHHQPQYVPQYVVQKPASQSQQQPAAMYIIAQPGQGPQTPQFQQAVNQLLNYYSSNPQARFQLLQQQGGVPQGFSQQGGQGLHQGGLPQGFLQGGLPQGLQQSLSQGSLQQGNLPQGYSQQPQQSYQQHGFPTGALHVIPSPQLENPGQYTQHPQFNNVGQASQQQQQFAGHGQPIFAVPAGITIPQHVLAQLTQSVQSPQHQSQQAPQQFLAQQFQQAAPQHFAPYSQQPQFSFAPQYHAQPQLSHLGGQGQFALKQASQAAQLLSSNEFQGQSDKTQAASSNYSPVYRTAYIKG